MEVENTCVGRGKWSLKGKSQAIHFHAMSSSEGTFCGWTPKENTLCSPLCRVPPHIRLGIAHGAGGLAGRMLTERIDLDP